MRTRLVLLGLTCVAIAACSASPGAATAGPASVGPAVVATATPSPSITAVATPSPSPTPDIAAMGTAYLAWSDWLRETSFALDKKFETATTKAKYSALYAEAVAIYVEAVARLSKLELVDSLEADRAKILAALAVAGTEAGKLSADPDYDPGAKLKDAQAAVAAAGANIRKALGLPPPPTPTS
jgi:hypothetical protein